MTAFVREARLLLRQRIALAAVLLLALFASLSVAFGLASVARERAAIERVIALQAADERAVMAFAEDAGYAAYYTFHPTWDAPSDLAFAALGGRDIAPAILRVRSCLRIPMHPMTPCVPRPGQSNPRDVSARSIRDQRPRDTSGRRVSDHGAGPARRQPA